MEFKFHRNSKFLQMGDFQFHGGIEGIPIPYYLGISKLLFYPFFKLNIISILSEFHSFRISFLRQIPFLQKTFCESVKLNKNNAAFCLQIMEIREAVEEATDSQALKKIQAQVWVTNVLLSNLFKIRILMKIHSKRIKKIGTLS